MKIKNKTMCFKNLSHYLYPLKTHALSHFSHYHHHHHHSVFIISIPFEAKQKKTHFLLYSCSVLISPSFNLCIALKQQQNTSSEETEMMQIIGKYRWRQSCRYKKLTDEHEKLKATTITRSARRQKLGKKNEIRAKGFRLNRSRKLVLKALALPRRIFNIYLRITNQMNKEGFYPNLVFSSHWGFPVLMNSRGGFR